MNPQRSLRSAASGPPRRNEVSIHHQLFAGDAYRSITLNRQLGTEKRFAENAEVSGRPLAQADPSSLLYPKDNYRAGGIRGPFLPSGHPEDHLGIQTRRVAFSAIPGVLGATPDDFLRSD